MNVKRWLISSFVVFVTFFVVEMVIHGMLLGGIYEATADLWRPQAEMEGLMWCMWLGYLLFSPLFVLIYSKGYEKGKGGVGQGLRYGLLLGIMLSPLMALGWYAVLAIPGTLAFYWFLAGIVEYTALGLVTGLTYKA